MPWFQGLGSNMIFQKPPSRCTCSLCREGCLCGDCSSCSDQVSDKIFVRNVKRVSVLCCLVLVVGSFMFFAPVVSLGTEAPVTVGVPAIRIQTSETSTRELCSIAFCYLGQGAVYANGIYYPLTKPVPTNIVQRHGEKRTPTPIDSRYLDQIPPSISI